MGLTRDALGRDKEATGAPSAMTTADDAPPHAPADLRTIADFLVWRFPHDTDTLLAKLRAGEVVDEIGRPLTLESPTALVGSFTSTETQTRNPKSPLPAMSCSKTTTST